MQDKTKNSLHPLKAIEALKKGPDLIEKWSERNIKNRKLLASLDRFPLHERQNTDTPNAFRFSEAESKEIELYLSLISELIPKKTAEMDFQTEINDLLKDVAKKAVISEESNNPTNDKETHWAISYLVSWQFLGVFLTALLLFFSLRYLLN